METSSNRHNDLNMIHDERERKEYLKEISLNDAMFSEFYSTLSDVELIYLSLNDSLTSTMINRLFEKSLDNVNINLLKNKHCPNKQIEHFLHFNDKLYNIALAHNEALDSAQFYRLFKEMDLDVNISLSFNPQTPQEIIKELVLLNNNYINEALCSNPNTPIDVLKQFMYDDSMRSCLTHNEVFKSYNENAMQP